MTERLRIFLLGGTGFIGTSLTQQLVATRHDHDLMMLIHRTTPLRHLEQVNTNSGSLSSLDLALFDRFRPDAVIHLARMSGRGRIGRYVAAWRGARANRRIISHLKAQPSKPHVIYVSGTLVYGDCGDTPADEDRPIHPIAFAREYIKAEQPWMLALEQGEIPVTILRPPWIIGKRSWFADFYLKSIRCHKVVPVFGEGRNLMSLIDVEDCAGLIVHAARNSVPGRNLNLFAPGACITQLEFAEKLAKYTHSEIKRLTAAEIRNRYGQTFWEAFTFSNVSSTKHPEFLAGYRFKYPTIDEMIRNNLPPDLRAE